MASGLAPDRYDLDPELPENEPGVALVHFDSDDRWGLFRALAKRRGILAVALLPDLEITQYRRALEVGADGLAQRAVAGKVILPAAAQCLAHGGELQQLNDACRTPA